MVRGTKDGKCRAYNARSGCQKANCRYKHLCMYCQSDHPIYNCEVRQSKNLPIPVCVHWNDPLSGCHHENSNDCMYEHRCENCNADDHATYDCYYAKKSQSNKSSTGKTSKNFKNHAQKPSRNSRSASGPPSSTIVTVSGKSNSETNKTVTKSTKNVKPRSGKNSSNNLPPNTPNRPSEVYNETTLSSGISSTKETPSECLDEYQTRDLERMQYEQNRQNTSDYESIQTSLEACQLENEVFVVENRFLTIQNQNLSNRLEELEGLEEAIAIKQSEWQKVDDKKQAKIDNQAGHLKSIEKALSCERSENAKLKATILELNKNITIMKLKSERLVDMKTKAKQKQDQFKKMRSYMSSEGRLDRVAQICRNAVDQIDSDFRDQFNRLEKETTQRE